MDEPRAENAPSVVGRYTLHGKIAAGGMATVHLGRLIGQGGFSRTVAIKRLHHLYVEDPEFAAMLLDEARLASRIRHPNVVPTLDVVTMKGELFVVMEYVHGVSLATLHREAMKRGERVAPRITVAVMAGVLHGLHAAHDATDEKGAPLAIVHRDVSPQNVLVGTDGIARVLDFGVAKARGRLQTTHDGRVKGKLSYMAPEQLKSRGCDRRSDVFAAGILLWESLTGKRLFTGDSEGEIVEKVLHAEIAAPSTVVAEMSPAFDDVTMRALQRAPDGRFATAQEMAVALEACEPAATSAQVGAWVDSLAHEALASRVVSIQAIESAPSIPSAAGVLVDRTQEAAARSEEPTRSEVASGSGISQLAMSRPSHKMRLPRNRAPAIALGVAAVAGASLIVVLTRLWSPAVPPAVPPASPATSAPAPVSAPAVAPAPAPSDTASSGLSLEAVPSASPSAALSAEPARSARPFGPPAARTAAHPVDCTDPYTRDELGRKIYKLECLH